MVVIIMLMGGLIVHFLFIILAEFDQVVIGSDSAFDHKFKLPYNIVENTRFYLCMDRVVEKCTMQALNTPHTLI